MGTRNFSQGSEFSFGLAESRPRFCRIFRLRVEGALATGSGRTKLEKNFQPCGTCVDFIGQVDSAVKQRSPSEPE